MITSQHCINKAMIIEHQNLERTYLLNIPTSVNEKPALFIALHGSGWVAENTIEHFNFQEFFEQTGYIGIVPNATQVSDGSQWWNADDIAYGISEIDDIGFIEKIIDRSISELNVDPKKVYVFGWSNGGFMASRIAMELSKKVKAIFTIAGTYRRGLELEDAHEKVSIHYLHATGDSTVPFDGHESAGYMSVPESVSKWAEQYKCNRTPNIIGPYDLTDDEYGNDTTTYQFNGENVSVELTAIEGSTHGPSIQDEKFFKLLTSFFEKN